MADDTETLAVRAELLARLRKVDPDQPGVRTRWYRNPDGPDAAREIEALAAGNARLERERDSALSLAREGYDAAREKTIERDAAIRERDEALDALRETTDRLFTQPKYDAATSALAKAEGERDALAKIGTALLDGLRGWVEGEGHWAALVLPAMTDMAAALTPAPEAKS